MIIAGLGNPGKEYENTRHNAGFWAIDSVAEKFRGSFDRSAFNAIYSSIEFHGNRHLLIKPQTFMNLSGEAVSSFMLETGTSPENLMVIADDINLPIGRLRLRASGSDGGHNGLKSIINHIGKGFWRLRIGVGQPGNNADNKHHSLVEYVLGSVSEEEKIILSRICNEIPGIAALWFMGMGNKAMTSYNGVNFCEPES